MIFVTQKRINLTIQTLITRVMQTGQLSRQEYSRLTSAVLADYQLTEIESGQIRRILDCVQIGRVKLID